MARNIERLGGGMKGTKQQQQQHNTVALKEDMRDAVECVLYRHGRLIVLCHRASRRHLEFAGVKASAAAASSAVVLQLHNPAGLQLSLLFCASSVI